VSEQPVTPQIYPEMMIEELVEKFPQLMEPLTRDYGFYCLNCLLSGFENLEEGAKMHGITDVEFEDMLEYLNQIVTNSPATA
jgi:hybrid cluster-associated redox disulfide protein